MMDDDFSIRMEIDYKVMQTKIANALALISIYRWGDEYKTLMEVKRILSDERI